MFCFFFVDKTFVAVDAHSYSILVSFCVSIPTIPCHRFLFLHDCKWEKKWVNLANMRALKRAFSPLFTQRQLISWKRHEMVDHEPCIAKDVFFFLWKSTIKLLCLNACAHLIFILYTVFPCMSFFFYFIFHIHFQPFGY